MKKKTLAEEIAELVNTAPKGLLSSGRSLHHRICDVDVDPEAFGSDREEEDDEGGRDHYISMGKRRIGTQESGAVVLDDARYKGSRISRAQLYQQDEDSENGSEESENGNSDNENTENGSSDCEGSEHGKDVAALRGYEFKEEAETTQEIKNVKPNRLQSELNRIAEDDQHLLRNVKANSRDDVMKGQHTRNQMALYDGLLDVRIRSQRLLNLANALPPPELYRAYLAKQKSMAEDPKSSSVPTSSDGGSSIISVQTQLAALFHQLQEVRYQMLAQHKKSFEVFAPAETSDAGQWLQAQLEKARRPLQLRGSSVSKNDKFNKNMQLDKSWMQWNELDRMLLDPFCQETLTKWQRKVQVGSLTSTKTNLKAFNLSLPHQIRQLLQTDAERLLKRTQLYRGNRKRLGQHLKRSQRKSEREALAHEDAVSEGKRKRQADAVDDEQDEEVFDDNDYYATLLRELIDSRVTSSDDPMAVGMHWVQLKALQHKNKKRRMDVDRRASKGRRLRFVDVEGGIKKNNVRCRYDVHEKLLHFMVPVEKALWHEDMIASLFSSLKKSSSL